MALSRSGLMTGRRLPVSGVLLCLVILCCLGAGCPFLPGFSGQQPGDGGEALGAQGGVRWGVGDSCCEIVPFATLEKFLPPAPSGWIKPDHPSSWQVNLGGDCSGQHACCHSQTSADYLLLDGSCKKDYLGEHDCGVTVRIIDMNNLPFDDSKRSSWGTKTCFEDSKNSWPYPHKDIRLNNRFDVCVLADEFTYQEQVDMIFNKIDLRGIENSANSANVINSCNSPIVTPTCNPSGSGQQRTEDPKCKTQKDKLILAMMLRNAFTSSALRELAYNSEADGNQYNLAATKLATQMRDTLKNTPDDNPVCRSDYDRAMEIYNQVSSGASSPFMDSVFQDSQAELIKALTADLTQQSAQSQAQSAGLSIGGTTDANCEFITNPSMDPAVEAHESAHIRYCQGHGKLKDMPEMTGEGGLLDYIHGTETYAYDAEIAYRMSELSSSGCQ